MDDMLGNKCLYCMTGAYDSMTGICPVCRHDRNYSNSDHQLPIGSVIGGRYLVGRVLGQGGFGITYIGWDIPKGQKIAIKEYFPSGCTARKKDNYTLVPYDDAESKNIYEQGKERFIREAERLKEVNNVPNIVRVSAFFTENNTAYIIMDYVEGMNFKEYLIRCGGKTSLSDALEKLHPVVTALSAIHRKNILHRDISPDNIVLSPLGAVLVDFGAAREYSFETPTSKTINVKTGYAPMEQYDAHGRQGPWTDVFAFASTIYRAITGVLPANAIKRSENSAELKMPHEFNPDISPYEEKVLLKGMEIDIQKRYQDIDSFYRDLIAAHSSRGESTIPIPHERNGQDKKKTTREKTSTGPKKDIFKIVLSVCFCLSLAYSLFHLIGIMVADATYKELFVQQLLMIGSFGALAFFMLSSFKKPQNERANLSQIILLSLFVISVISGLIFLAIQDDMYYYTLNFIGIMIYTHIPLLIILNVLMTIYSKKKYGRIFPDFKKIFK